VNQLLHVGAGADDFDVVVYLYQVLAINRHPHHLWIIYQTHIPASRVLGNPHFQPKI
jgi:hypothetical protein